MAAVSGPSPKEEQKEASLFPEPPTSVTEALATSAPAGEDGGSEDGEVRAMEEDAGSEVAGVVEVEDAEESSEEEEPLKICADEEDLRLDDNNNEAGAAVKAPRKEKKDSRLPKKSSRRNRKVASSRSEEDIRDALHQLAGTSTEIKPTLEEQETLRTVKLLAQKIKIPEQHKWLPVALRLGPPVREEAPEPLPSTSAQDSSHPGYFTAEGWKKRGGAEENEGGAALASGPAAAVGDLPPQREEALRGEEGKPQARVASQQALLP